MVHCCNVSSEPYTFTGSVEADEEHRPQLDRGGVSLRGSERPCFAILRHSVVRLMPSRDAARVTCPLQACNAWRMACASAWLLCAFNAVDVYVPFVRRDDAGCSGSSEAGGVVDGVLISPCLAFGRSSKGRSSIVIIACGIR